MVLYVDADGCSAPARAMAVRLTARGVLVVLVSDRALLVREFHDDAFLSCVQVAGAPDAADAYIIQNIKKNDALITRDIMLAKAALELGGSVISDYGEIYDSATIDARAVSARARAIIREVYLEGETARKKRSAKEHRQRAEKLARFLDAWMRKNRMI